MNTQSMKKELISLLYRSCLDYLKQYSTDIKSEKVYAFTIYCSSAFRNMALAISTRESLARRISKGVGNEPELFYEVNAAEWEYVNLHYGLFDKVDEKIDELYNEFYDGEFEDVDLEQFDDEQLWEYICEFYSDVIIRTLKNLKQDKVFNSRLFEDDLLLGIQFGDPDEGSIKVIEQISAELNSSCWHKKIKNNCKYLLHHSEYSMSSSEYLD